MRMRKFEAPKRIQHDPLEKIDLAEYIHVGSAVAYPTWIAQKPRSNKIND